MTPAIAEKTNPARPAASEPKKMERKVTASVIVAGGIALTAWLALTTYCMRDVLSTARAVSQISA
jgi:hypothetical protein